MLEVPAQLGSARWRVTRMGRGESNRVGATRDHHRAALRFDVQHPIKVTGMTVHPDLADLEARVILEAYSWEFHTGCEAHVRDCWRYNELVAEGLSVLRFTWWHVMEHPDYIVETLSRVYGRSPSRAEGQDLLTRSA